MRTTYARHGAANMTTATLKARSMIDRAERIIRKMGTPAALEAGDYGRLARRHATLGRVLAKDEALALYRRFYARPVRSARQAVERLKAYSTGIQDAYERTRF